MGKKTKFYGVRQGRKTGVFSSWEECKESIHGYSGAIYKSFFTYKEALDWYQGKEDSLFEILSEEEAGDTSEDLKPDFEVYTDGSYREEQYSWAYAFVKDGKVIYEDSSIGKNPAAASMRNVAGEIAAVLYAVKRASELRVKIRIYHDYAGIAHWATGEWRAKNEFTKFYAQKMRKYRGIYSFRKVKSHSGNQFNDYVDQKAKEALEIKNGG
ncbi:MAG: double-stranded DNA-binding protein [Desulfitobacterium sp.]|nr:double-stranded DNA-binding protein [Desulfitobacterium sp.]